MNLKQIITEEKQLAIRREKQLIREENNADSKLEQIQQLISKYITKYSLDVLVNLVIDRGLVTKDELTKSALFESTRLLVIDILSDMDDYIETS